MFLIHLRKAGAPGRHGSDHSNHPRPGIVEGSIPFDGGGIAMSFPVGSDQIIAIAWGGGERGVDATCKEIIIQQAVALRNTHPSL